MLLEPNASVQVTVEEAAERVDLELQALGIVGKRLVPEVGKDQEVGVGDGLVDSDGMVTGKNGSRSP